MSLVAKKLRSLIAGADRKLGNANKHHGLGDNISTMRRNQLVKWLKRRLISMTGIETLKERRQNMERCLLRLTNRLTV